MSLEIGNENYALFKQSSNNSYKYIINPDSGVANNIHLEYFKFIGRLLGMSIIHSQHLSISFTTLFYKRLLSKDLCLSDLEYIDPELYNNLKQLK